jgi:hypothetical protein
MIFPASISNLMMQHLSLSHDEQLSTIRQHTNGHLNNLMTGISAARQSQLATNQASTATLNTIRTGEVMHNNGVAQLNRLPVLKSTLQAQSIQSSASSAYLRIEADNRQTESDDQQSSQKQSPESLLDQALEVQSLQTVVETAAEIVADMQYESLFVSLLYLRAHALKTQGCTKGQIMTVSPLVSVNGRISAHSTLLVSGSDGFVKKRHLATQLVCGRQSLSTDWLVASLQRMPEIPGEVWRVSAEYAQHQLAGTAVVLKHEATERSVLREISLHIPGIHQLWNPVGVN